MKTIKNLFSTPRKAILTVLCTLGLMAVVGTGTVYAASSIAESSSIGAENAKNFAFADAGVDPVTAENIRAKFDFEKGTFVYEVEFIAGGVEYEYLIKASDGSVIKKETEVRETESVPETEQIGIHAAREKALADADLSQDEVTFTKEETDMDDGVLVYEIEFCSADYEYEYEIDAFSGKILSRSKEVRRAANTSQPGQDSESQPADSQRPGQDSESEPDKSDSETSRNDSSAQNGTIGVAAAKAKALENAGVSAEAVTFTKAKLDYEDGLPVYEIEFYTADYEYEYEIDATTGRILERSKEALKNSVDKDGNTPAGSSYIGTDKAKTAALRHAGLSTEEVVFTKVKLETEKDLAVYEIEFCAGGMEYEYTVNAVNGNILAYEAERDD